MIPSLQDIEQLDESALSEQLHSQIADTLKTESELAVVVRQRDEWKGKAEIIGKLQEGNKGVNTETIEKLIESTRRLDADIRRAEENTRLYTEADPHKMARDLRKQTERLKTLNCRLRFERAAKAVVCNQLMAQQDRTPRQLQIVTEAEITSDKNLMEILSGLEEEKRKGRGKRRTESMAALSNPAHE